MIVFILLFSFKIFALEALMIGDRYPLPKSSSYHFSNKDLISLHPLRSPLFFVTKKPGKLFLKTDKLNLKYIILDEQQKYFFEQVTPYTQNSSLKWSVKNSKLLLSGHSPFKKLSQYLLKSCLESESPNIHLKIYPPPEYSTSSTCLGHSPSVINLSFSLLLINKDRIKSSKYGIGLPSNIGWSLSELGRPQLQKLLGEISTGGGKSSSQGEFLFEGLISKLNPLHFKTGSEVGIPSRSFLSKRGTEWKKAFTSIELELLSYDSIKSKVQITFNKNSRTKESLVFSKERFKKTLQIKNNLWLKVASFSENSFTKNSSHFLKLNLLGSLGRAKTNTAKELWILVNNNQKEP